MRSKRILFFFNHKAEHEIDKIISGDLPSDRLYGLLELRKMGWTVDLCDERITPFEMKFRRYFLSINIKTLIKASQYDIWLVKDQFSLILTLASFFMRKRLIYIDSLFHVPKNPLRKFILYINTKLASQIVTYSQYQVDLWTSLFNLNRKKFIILPYTIDPNFYLKGMQSPSEITPISKPYILSTGRDIGRDFHTLVNASFKAGFDVKLVTLPYLVPAINNNEHSLHIYENISYGELFGLYKFASIVVVPLKKGVVYPSGIRATFEGMLAGKPVICSSTPILSEYIPENNKSIIYVDAENSDDLVKNILLLKDDPKLQESLSHNAKERVTNSFNLEIFAAALDKILLN